MKWLPWIFISLLWLNEGLLAQSQSSLRFSEVEAALDFRHNDGSYGQYFLIESMSAGLAMFDYDGDGDLDIYLLNGARIELPNTTEPNESSRKDSRPAANPPQNKLFRNDGDFHFTDVTHQAGVGDTSMSLGVAVADYDNDGQIDVYLSNYGPNVFYHNNGDGTFSERTSQTGSTNGFKVGGGVTFFDKDQDGDLDLYIGNYIQLDLTKHKIHYHKGLPAYPSPMSFHPEADTLLENQGDGTFVDVSESSGIRQVAGRSMAVVSFDYDSDGDFDIYVANDTQENHLFENDGSGHFEEIGLLAGVAFDYSGKPQASMGIALCDLDHDSLLDLAVTSFSEEFTTIYKNEGGFFSDATLQIGASAATFPHVTWGIVGEDLDNDGYPEFLVGAGDLDEQRDARGGASQATAFAVPNVLLSATADGRLKVVESWGPAQQLAHSTRGLLAADLNQDGLPDVVALNARSMASLLQNQSQLSGKDSSSSNAGTRASLSLRLVGRQSNRDAIGAVVRVSQKDQPTQVQQIHSGHSYQSDLRGPLHFGVDASATLQVEVSWPSGVRQTIDLAAGKTTIVETQQ